MSTIAGAMDSSARSLGPSVKFICHDLDQRMIADVGVLTRERYECFRAGYGIDFGEAFSQWVHDNAEHVAIDIAVQGGERLRLGADISVDILHTPGHSRGHLSLWLADRRTAIISDAVLGRNVPTADGRPFSPPTYRYVDSYLGTIARLQSMDIDVLLTGHNQCCAGRMSRQFLADSRAFVDELDAYILRLLDDASLTTPELIGSIDPAPVRLANRVPSQPDLSCRRPSRTSRGKWSYRSGPVAGTDDLGASSLSAQASLEQVSAGLKVLTLRNDHLRVRVLVSKGADILEICRP